MIDEQVGLVQNIRCDTSVFTPACHLLEGSICHLLKHCGDDQERFVGCKWNMAELHDITPTFLTIMWAYRYVFAPIFIFVIVFVMLAIVPEII